MRSITLHKMDEQLARALDAHAMRQGTSLNRAAQELLRAGLGLPQPGAMVDHTDEFRDLFGTWEQSDVDSFRRRVTDLDKVDPADWTP